MQLVVWNAEKSSDINDKLTNRDLAASEEYYCQETRRIIKVADKNDHLEPDDREKKKQSVVVKLVKKIKNENSKSKSFHIKSTPHMCSYEEKFQFFEKYWSYR